KKAQNDTYYAQMAFAWLVSTCYVKFPEITFEFLNNVEINNQVKNKIVRKVLDSFRVKEDNKRKLKDWAQNIV
ncbi:MAG: DNA alkylation repair protein, partial [Oscillospiraceae bacterium]